MSRSIAARFFSTLSTFSNPASVCARCHASVAVAASFVRPFSSTSPPQADEGKLSRLSNLINDAMKTPTDSFSSFGQLTPMAPPVHKFHVYATKHNTHITLTRPSGVFGPDGKELIPGPRISVACGNIGFRKAGRGNYDAAYQLAAYVMNMLQDKGLLAEIKQMEVVLRGFGPGREAVTKALMGAEGRNLRGKVVRVTDATRLKFGGTRSPARRRLG